MKKIQWNIMLLLAITFFGLSLISERVLFNIPAVILAFIIHRFGSVTLFKDYYERKRKKEKV